MEVKELTKIRDLSPQPLLEGLLHFVEGTEGHLAAWKLPNQKILHAIVQLSPQLVRGKHTTYNSLPGFLVSPFLNPGLQSCYFIQAELHIALDLERGTISLDAHPDTPQDMQERLIRRLMHNGSPTKGNHLDPSRFQAGTSGDLFRQNVQEGIRNIQSGHLKKVVFSRTKQLDLTEAFSMTLTIERLIKQHGSHFVSLISSPELGTWFGSSPEILVSVDHVKEEFRTVSLAGTQANLHNDPKEAAWRQKEIEEQALVSRFIINCFKKIRLREFEEIGPKSVLAGNLIHLKSEFIVRFEDLNFPDLGDVMLELLHPTSAVSGMPKKEAQEFVLHHEAHDRMLYSGFLGPVQIEGKTNLFVNLRCATVHQDSITLFAGAGITEDSDPQMEWEETEMKCETLARFILSNTPAD